MSAQSRKNRQDLAAGLGFLVPNIAGFLVFTLFPLLFSLMMAFTNWDLRLHNIFKQEHLRFVGIENFVRLATEADFWQYLGNTLFLMMGIPFGVAGSLGAAILLSQDARGGNRAVWARLLATTGLVTGLGLMLLVGFGAGAMPVLICGLGGLILFGGAAGGNAVHRTLFYFPHFTAGVATYLLWKKLYSPHTGPVNNALRPVLELLSRTVRALPAWVPEAGVWLLVAAMLAALCLGVWRIRALWRDGEMGWLAVGCAIAVLAAPVAAAPFWARTPSVGVTVLVAGAVILSALVGGLCRRRDFRCQADRGLGHAVIVCGGLMVGMFVCLGLTIVAGNLAAWNSDGLAPPDWLTHYHWAKPSIMIMGFWAAVGSNNMLLYLAGLSNVPPELYEASDIDGASRMQRFWHVTWPQLAPVTFFILVMAVIQGLQGGFEMARTMTQGGPAGATTTLSYYVYTEGFETGRIGYASAVAWALFLLVFAVTLFNWKFGNRYVND